MQISHNLILEHCNHPSKFFIPIFSCSLFTPPVPSNHYSIFSLSRFPFSRHFMWMESYNMWSFTSDFLHLMFLRFIYVPSPFIFYISLYFIIWIYHTCLYIHKLIDIFFHFWAIMNNTDINICAQDIGFHFSWVDPRGWFARAYCKYVYLFKKQQAVF